MRVVDASEQARAKDFSTARWMSLEFLSLFFRSPRPLNQPRVRVFFLRDREISSIFFTSLEFDRWTPIAVCCWNYLAFGILYCIGQAISCFDLHRTYYLGQAVLFERCSIPLPRNLPFCPWAMLTQFTVPSIGERSLISRPTKAEQQHHRRRSGPEEGRIKA